MTDFLRQVQDDIDRLMQWPLWANNEKPGCIKSELIPLYKALATLHDEVLRERHES